EQEHVSKLGVVVVTDRGRCYNEQAGQCVGPAGPVQDHGQRPGLQQLRLQTRALSMVLIP
ncbi:hypothetical protein NHX12_011169, partial [Muraenolepis orangiensis]